ncbi:MAG TPA: glycosyltransferase family 39 protein [Solirubrobacteraceae bacterium]|nr:glycosyltransferase family 39 protein [Solirubrobacteraceae bacterium]
MSTSEHAYVGKTGGGDSAKSVPGALAAAAGTVRVQLTALLALSAVLNLWALSRNGWANLYYSAAVRSMSSSWHDFLFASMDKAGAMTVDKPPLALWVQALSVRVFGYHPLAVLVPQALMGMASVALVYDLVRRRFGGFGGFVAGLALAITPIEVAVSRHNNPDALLVLCSVAALWFTVRALEKGSGRWLALAGVCVGLGFETKMGVALMVVPGIVAAWLWIAPRGRGRALLELAGAGGAALLVGGAWPALVELTPASARPWISGTSGNTVWELISQYNGAGRLDGQTGGPAGAGGNMFGGTTGPTRLLNAALGGQAGWLLGFALVGGLAVLLACRLRRGDERSGWLLLVGGSFAVTAVVFSEAKGIFHPYYVSLLAPFAAALTGAGAAQLRGLGRGGRVLGPLAVAAGVAVELVVLSRYPGELEWLVPLLLAVGVATALLLALARDGALRTGALVGALCVLAIGPAIWAVDTLGHATSGTFPEGGPASALTAGGGPGGPGGFGGRGGGARRGGAAGFAGPSGAGAAGRLGGAGGPGAAGGGAAGGPPAVGSQGGGGVPLFGGASGSSSGSGGNNSAAAGAARLGGPGGGGALGAPLGNSQTIARAVAYAKAHGGGTVAVESQSSAATEIVDDGAEVAGIGGFSGRESDVSVSWLAEEVAKGKIRWVLSEGSSGGGPRLAGDTRTGSRSAMAAAAKACAKVTLGQGEGASETGAASESGESGLYDCKGRAVQLRKA